MTDAFEGRVTDAERIAALEAEVARLKEERDWAEIANALTLKEWGEMRDRLMRDANAFMADYLLTCESEWLKTADKLGDARDQWDRAQAESARFREALLAIAERGGCSHWSHRFVQDAGVRLPPDLLPD